MTESAPKYHVVLHESRVPNDLGEMTKTEVLRYMRLHTDATDTVLRKLEEEVEEKGKATLYLENPLGPKIRVEIRRL